MSTTIEDRWVRRRLAILQPVGFKDRRTQTSGTFLNPERLRWATQW